MSDEEIERLEKEEIEEEEEAEKNKQRDLLQDLDNRFQEVPSSPNKCSYKFTLEYGLLTLYELMILSQSCGSIVKMKNNVDPDQLASDEAS